ncbi:MAG TPA: hypothetical protein VLL52_10205 [Anaerolineae bacterium]|nr:hypothetical protein [Anaerolineae bacterium]
MMIFRVKRLASAVASGCYYHLFNEQGILMMVGDYGRPWLEGGTQVRFAWPDGQLLATLSLPRWGHPGWGWGGRRQYEYGLVIEDAVYASMQRHQPGQEGVVYFTLEVDGQRLVLWGDDSGAGYGLYEQGPSDFDLYMGAEVVPETAVGWLRLVADESYRYEIEWRKRFLSRAALLSLALVCLWDQGEELAAIGGEEEEEEEEGEG